MTEESEAVETEHKPLVISAVKDVARDVREIELDHEMSFEPGQYVMLWIPDVSKKPLSIKSGYPLMLAVKKRGDWSTTLYEKEEGDKVFIEGPLGRGFTHHIIRDDVSSSTPVIGIAGGYGSVPIFAAIELLYGNGFYSLHAMLGAKTSEELLYAGDLKELCTEGNVRVSTEDGSEGREGMVTDLFEDLEGLGISTKDQPFFLMCGPEGMMKAAAEKAKKYTQPERILVSLERYMKCGKGICGSCEAGGLSVCEDGPVFPYSQLMGNVAFGVYERAKSGRRIEYD